MSVIASVSCADPGGRQAGPGSLPSDFSPDRAVKGIDESDWREFNHLTAVELGEREKALAACPSRKNADAEEFLAVHWHPEWVSLELIQQRLKLAFPSAGNFLAIPTQHNRIMSLGSWAGVEADVYDRRYNMKVQLLVHLASDKLGRAGTLIDMMNRTFNYRAHQLLDILNRLADPDAVSAKVQASLKCSVSDDALKLARFFAIRLRAMIEQSEIIGSSRDEMLKNRLLPDFILARTGQDRRMLAEQAIMFINAVKKTVKAELNPDAFFSPMEVIEEARALGGGIVIPHPPIFWPILISDLDVDGWEVWNSSTPNHTLFLLEALERANQARRGPRLLAFMGDDTHMSAKIRLNGSDEKDSAQREIGFQGPWEDPAVKHVLKATGQSLVNTINEYRARIA